MRAEPEIELAPDAWARFERAVDVVAKSPPQPRKSPTAETGKAPRKRPKKNLR